MNRSPPSAPRPNSLLELDDGHCAVSVDVKIGAHDCVHQCNKIVVQLHPGGKAVRVRKVTANATPIAEVIAAAVDDGALPPRPDGELDVYLDAAEICVRRYGWSRTSPQDIAREASVNRTTVYRVLGAKDEIFRLLVAREVHRLIDRAAQLVIEVRENGTPGAEAIIELTASAIEQVRDNPTIAKLLADEPALVAGFMRDDVPAVIERFTDVLGPLLGVAMERGAVAQRDPRLMTEWMVRMCLSLLFAPPPIDLRLFLGQGIRPLFDVDRPGAGGTRGRPRLRSARKKRRS